MKSIRDIEWRYYLIQFLFWFATGLPLALIVLLIKARGLDLFEIGIMFGVMSAVIVVLELPTGGLADAIGRKPITLAAYIIMSLFSVLLIFSFSFEAYVATYALYGVGRALSSGALDAWFLDSLKSIDPKVDIQPRLARAGTFILLGLGSGTFLGGLVAQLFSSLPPDGTAILTPSAMPIVFSSVIKIALVFLTFILIKEDRTSYESQSFTSGIKEVPSIIKNGFSLASKNVILLLMLGATFVSGISLSSLENLWQPRFDLLLGDLEGKTIYMGAIMGGTFLIGMIGNMLSTTLTRILKKRYALVAMIGRLLSALALFALAIFVNPILAAIAFWISYFALGVSNSPQGALVNEEIPANQRSSMLSIFSLMSYFGSIAGSIGLGYIAQTYSIPTAWLIAGAVVLLSVLFFLKADRHREVSVKTG